MLNQFKIHLPKIKHDGHGEKKANQRQRVTNVVHQAKLVHMFLQYIIRCIQYTIICVNLKGLYICSLE